MPAMAGFGDSELRRLADLHGVTVSSTQSRDEVAEAVADAIHRAHIVDEAQNAAVVAAVCVAVAVGKACRDRDPEGYYACLGLKPGASEEEVKIMHRTKSLLLHEDRHVGQGGELAQLAKEMQQRVNEAKEVLSDPRMREAYHHQGTAGIARSALVPQHLGTKEFIQSLDIIAQREKLVRLHRELESSGTMYVRFSALDVFQPLTDRLHALYGVAGDDPDFAVEEEEYEEYEEDEEYEEYEDEEYEEYEEGEESEAEGGVADAAQTKVAAHVTKAMVNGEMKYVLVLDDNIVAQLQARGNRMIQHADSQPDLPNMRTQLMRHGCHLLGFSHEDLEASLARRATATLAGFAAQWPRVLLPYPSQLNITHSFTQPLGAKQTLRFSCGGPTLWFSTALSYVQNSMQEFKAKLLLRLNQTSVSFNCIRKITPALDWILRYKVTSSRNDGKVKGRLQNTMVLDLGEDRALEGTLSMAASDTEKRLEWKFTKADNEGNSLSYELDCGWMSLTYGLVSQLMIPRIGSTNSTGADEEEAEAKRNLGALVSVFSQDLHSGAMRLSWRAVLNTSATSTANKIGFGVSTTLPNTLPWSSGRGIASTEFELILQRNSFSLRVPLLISTASDFPTVATYLTMPLLIYKTLRSVVKAPWDRFRRRAEFVRRRHALKEKIWDDRRRAMREQDLLRDEAKRREEEEMNLDGLVIQNAKYGCLHAMQEDEEMLESEGLPPRTLDVTATLQAKVQQSTLVLNAGPKHRYDGFYDVDPEGGDERYLRVLYLFHGEPHEVEVLDDMELVLPLREHRINDAYDSPRHERQ